ncbi:MAG: Fic family protein [Proteobacteria bacterium]|nr:Fic family protein [Candidatus Enterousia onthequi]
MVKVSDFVSEYKTVRDPSKKEKARNWDIAIGLQKVDGLQPSKYLYQVARDNIDGKLSHAKVYESLHKYYQTDAGHAQGENTKEADLVSNRIAELLGNSSFTFAPPTLMNIHKYLFQDVLPDEWVGKVRSEDITKKEAVLNNDTVHYASHIDVMPTLRYDFEQEKRFDYSGLTKRAQVEHIAEFVSGIWQIHPFREGNTRTIAVFTIKYLRNKGFMADNELFKDNAEYFRNALVRANYENVTTGVKRTTKYLYLFFGNLLLGEHNSLEPSDISINIANFDKKASDIISDKLNKTENAFIIKLMPLLCKNGEITASDAINATGKSAQRVRQLFVALVDKGILIAIGQNKGRKYKLKA